MESPWSEFGWLIATAGAAVILAGIALARTASTRQHQAESADRNLIGRAMRHHGLTPSAAEQAGLESALLAARQRCSECGSTSACRMQLDNGQGPLTDTACPNSRLFSHLAQAIDGRPEISRAAPSPTRPPDGGPGVV